ncbi:hypothetical protein [Vibrio crassostreae]|uniref:hypothetical protein n=1 Tax=Vibrio crassostreae TaxID=246167 RepID=UPI001053250E|nr:hypothetical protein [Vibrio crassostreae]TCN91477.1 hypothetical protein EDB37_1002246 [Vibrio crassostreae]
MEYWNDLLSKKKGEIYVYKRVLGVCLERLFDMVFCARFMFFAAVTVAIGTTGIWVPVIFQIDMSPLKSLCNSISIALDHENILMPKISLCSTSRVIRLENFSMFMYVVGVLGMLAAEFFIKGKAKDAEEDEVKLAFLSFCMFVWFFALILSFWGLKFPTEDSWQLKVSVWLSVSLWLSSIYTHGGFERDALKVLAGEGRNQEERSKSPGKDFSGEGMDD